MLFRYGDRNNLTFVLPRSSNIFDLNDVREEELVERSERPPTFLSTKAELSNEAHKRADIFCLHTWMLNVPEIQSSVKEGAVWATILREPREQFASMIKYAR